MRATRILTTMLTVILIVPPCMASTEDSGSSGVLPDVCPDFSDLSPWEHQRLPIPYYCQILDGIDPVPQGNAPPSSSVDLSNLSYLYLGLAHGFLTVFRPWACWC